MSFRISSLLLLAALATACAQVPQSSVTLSNSIGEDMGSMQKAHKDFVNFYFDALEQQANELIDNKYRPSLIRQIIEMDVAKFKDSSKRHQSLFNAIQRAFIDNSGLDQNALERAQSNAMQGMKIFYTKIDKKVEIERKALLNPLRQQRTTLLSNIDANYANIARKNAAITGLLSSVTDVHETQQSMYEMAGGEGNIREQAGEKLTDLAEKIARIQEKVDEGTPKVGEIEAAIAEFKEAIGSSD